MKKVFLLIQLFLLVGLLTLVCVSQTNKSEETREPQKEEKVIDETNDCLKEFKEPFTNIAVTFCGEPQKNILGDSFKKQRIKRNNYTVSSSSATYVLGWFAWKLKKEDDLSLRKLFDEYTNDTLKKDSSGLVKEIKEITLNGKPGRELILDGNVNEFAVRLYYSGGNLIYLVFLPNSSAGKKEILDSLKENFFESFKIFK